MSSNLYLFDPKKVQSNTAQKPLIQVMREAEIARSEESVRIFKSVATRVASLFGSKKPASVAQPATKSAGNTVATPVEEERLAA